MSYRTGITIALLAATACLALAAAGSWARSFSVTEKNYEAIWNNALTGKTKFTFGDAIGHHVECNLTLLGRFAASTIGKRTEVNGGTINHAELEGCVNGTATLRTETMPWNTRYRGFTGALPGIETISTGVNGSQWKVRDSEGLECTVRTEVLEPGVGIIEGTALESIRADETRTIRLGGALCSFVSPGHVAGRGLIRNLPRTANVTITLI